MMANMMMFKAKKKMKRSSNADGRKEALNQWMMSRWMTTRRILSSQFIARDPHDLRALPRHPPTNPRSSWIACAMRSNRRFVSISKYHSNHITNYHQ